MCDECQMYQGLLFFPRMHKAWGLFRDWVPSIRPETSKVLFEGRRPDP